MTIRRYRYFAAGCAAVAAAAAGYGQESKLADYFGFQELEVVKIGRSAGPAMLADMNGDGLNDLVVVNNRASRIELHYQKEDARPSDVTPPDRVNEFPEHWRYRRQNLSVTHRVDGVVAHDFDGDGRMDLIYAGQPPELVFLRQTEPGVFEMSRRHRVRGLSANRNGLAVANVIGDDAPELLAIVNGAIHVWPLRDDLIGEPTKLSAGDNIIAFMIEDYNGDGRNDVAGILPENASPVRLWLAETGLRETVLGAQRRFELPPLREFEPVRLPGESAARLATIERASKRLVVYELSTEPIELDGDRDASLRVFSFTDDRNRKRDHAVVDVDGDGLLDLVATDTEANALAVYRQVKGKGLQTATLYPSLSDLDSVAAGNVDDDKYAELFVLSESEGVVGRSDVSDDGVPFPSPLSISDGYSPVALSLVELDGRPHVAVVARDRRQYQVDLLDMDGQRTTVDLGSLSRSPETVMALDADQNGRTDLLLFTRDKPMTMLYAEEDGFTLMESEDMGQFGLVQDAGAANTAVQDVDGDGKDELLIAAKNFVRAVRYDPDPGGLVNPGWQVVTQVNARDSTSKLVSLTVLGERIFVADEENARLVVIARDGGEWTERESVNVRGFEFSSIHAGSFSGDDSRDILAIGDDGFAIIKLSGQRVTLHETNAWRTSDERRVQHELATGDVNSDGFQDMVALDAGEQMCEIFTFTARHEMLYATGFKVYESRLFSGGEPREFQPREVHIGDVTGDGANDLVMLSHDRVLIYPQMTRADVAKAED